MLFNSLTFAVFLSVVLVIHWLPLPWRLRKVNLVIASYVFYGAWNPPFIALLAISTLVDWFAARLMWRAGSAASRRLWLTLSLATNLGLLGFFKYAGFFLDLFVDLVGMVGIVYRPPELDIVLPIGISFYTFQSLSYTIDVYRGRMRPWPSFVDFALFVSFFPQLVAGPIVRAADFLPQCNQPPTPTRAEFGWGATLLLIGLTEKMILADTILAPVADHTYAHAADVGSVEAWVGTLAFSAQIFYDFAGYSTCAIGIGLLLGFALPDNFRHPYGAIGFSDFWRRWHISLSSWLRDYLYISLGGNRRGEMRTYSNLAVTMLLGGLWHGANWRFVVWGALHGVYLIVERLARPLIRRKTWARRTLPRLAAGATTFTLVLFTWVFFRAASFDDAFEILAAMMGNGVAGRPPDLFVSSVVLSVVVWQIASQIYMRHRTLEDVWQRLPWVVQAALIATMIVGLAFTPGDRRAFIYFQF